MSTDSPNHVYYANRANAYLESNENKKCIQDCDTAIEIDPKFIKSYLRKARAYLALEQLEEALECINKGLEHEADT